MTRQFIIGENTAGALKNLKKIRKDGFAFTVDILGEASVSEEESEAYLREYLELLEALRTEYAAWPALGGQEMNWGRPKKKAKPKPATETIKEEAPLPAGTKVINVRREIGRASCRERV